MIEHPLGIFPRIYIAGSWSRLILNLLRIFHTDFQSGCIWLPSHQPWRSVPFITLPLIHLNCHQCFFFILAILPSVRWYLRVVLIFIYLIIKDFEQFLQCLSATWNSSVENSLFISVPHFLIVLFWCRRVFCLCVALIGWIETALAFW